VEVNGVMLPRTDVRGEASFSVWLPLPDARHYRVKVTVLEFTSTEGRWEPVAHEELALVRQHATPPRPVILGIQPTSDPDEFRIAGIADPCSAVTVEGGLMQAVPRQRLQTCANLFHAHALDPSDVNVSHRGRFDVIVRYAAGTDKTIALRSRNHAGVPSTATPSFTRSEAAVFEPPARSDGAESEVTIAFEVQPLSSSVTYTVRTAKELPELGDYVTGEHGLELALDELVGTMSIGPFRDDDGCPAGVFAAPLDPSLEIDTAAKLTVRQELPDVVTILNGLGSRPRLTFCFSRGMPPLGATGQFELSVHGYEVVSATPPPTEVKASDGVATYTWSGTSPDQPVTVELARDVTNVLGFLPHLNAVQAGPGDPLLSILASVGFALVTILPAMLGITVVTLAVATPDSARSAARGVLTVGAALIVLPFMQWLADAVLGNQTAREVESWLGSLGEADGYFLAQFGALLVVSVAVLLVWARFRARLLGHLLLPLLLAAALASVVALVLAFLSAFPEPSTAVDSVAVEPAPVYLIAGAVLGGLVMATVITYASFALLQVAGIRISRWEILAAGAFIIVICVHVAWPRGEAAFTSADGPQVYRSTLRSLLGLVTYGYAFLAFVAVALLAVRGYGSKTWERMVHPRNRGAVDTFRQRGADYARWRNRAGAVSTQGQFLLIGVFIFAAYVIGNTGVLLGLVPVSFLAALLAYYFVILRPADQVAEDARTAAGRRTSRLDRLRSRPAIEPDAEEAANERDDSESAKRPFLALGPFELIGQNARYGIAVGAILSLIWLPFSLPQLPSLSGDDPHLWARLLVTIAVLASRWVILGFFIGAYFDFIRGSTGIRKALWLAAIIIVISAPFDFLGATSAQEPLWVVPYKALVTLMFTAAIGAAFDMRILLAADRERGAFAALSDAMTISGLQRPVAAGLAFIGPVGLAVVALLQSQLTQAVSNALAPWLLPPSGPQVP
jgi:hypothetical protein